MTLQPPEPFAAAQREAEQLRLYPHIYPEEALRGVLADCPWVDPVDLLRGIEEFHRQRMNSVPPSDRYPEAAAWAEYVLAVDRHLQGILGLTDRQMAIHRSLNAFVTFRGFVNARPRPAERCRVLFDPTTDRGAMHIKNVDNPAKGWRRLPPPQRYPCSGLVWDGVGSGLPIDDEPTEIFPLPIRQMCNALCADVPSAVEFLSRYSQFWGQCNTVFYDAQKRSVAIEKCSYNHMQVYRPGPDGRSHVSGMACRDANSTIARYQRAKRNEYSRRFDLADNGADATFWAACDRAEEKLGQFLARPGPIPSQEIIELFVTPLPAGLNKTGVKICPEQSSGEYTLCTLVNLPDERTVLRWQRDEKSLGWPAAPEVYRF